jgi:peptide/nickel transport system permease protein
MGLIADQLEPHPPPDAPPHDELATVGARKQNQAHPIRDLIVVRSLWGVFSVFVVSLIVYFATLVLPGDAATAILGQQATPERLKLLRHQLHLDQPALSGFWHWFTGLFHGDFGQSLSRQQPVWQVVRPNLENSVVLIVAAAVLSTVIGITLGTMAAARRDRPIDHLMSVLALAASALPEFVVGVFVVLLFSVRVFHWFPAISILPPGSQIWDQPKELVLPALTLIIVITPYVFRMIRASTIEALSSDYAEVARLKGVSETRLLFRHALPNALAPSIQVVGLNLLYLAGGIVLVETVFQFPGIGLLLVSAISGRDVPMIQFLVLILSTFYVVLNIVTDVGVLLVTPRRRAPR